MLPCCHHKIKIPAFVFEKISRIICCAQFFLSLVQHEHSNCETRKEKPTDCYIYDNDSHSFISTGKKNSLLFFFVLSVYVSFHSFSSINFQQCLLPIIIASLSFCSELMVVFGMPRRMKQCHKNKFSPLAIMKIKKEGTKSGRRRGWSAKYLYDYVWKFIRSGCLCDLTSLPSLHPLLNHM
jgi:hypothetical protein